MKITFKLVCLILNGRYTELLGLIGETRIESESVIRIDFIKRWCFVQQLILSTSKWM